MFEINLIFYGLSSMLQFSQFVWPLSYSVWDVFYNFLLIDATDRSKISRDQKRFFIALSLYPLSFFANTPFKNIFNCIFSVKVTNKCLQQKHGKISTDRRHFPHGYFKRFLEYTWNVVGSPFEPQFCWLLELPFYRYCFWMILKGY